MFETFELSRFLGKPVRLFEFVRQSVVWRYADADRDVVAGGHTWIAAQIERDEIKQTAERAKDKLKIRLAYLRDPAAPASAIPGTQPLGDNWHPFIPSDTVTVRCLATHYGDTDQPTVEWIGQVAQPVFTDMELELTCEPGSAIAEAANQGPKWQRGCWKSVYSTGLSGCNLIAGPIPVPAVLTAVAGNDITAAEFAAPPRAFVGGTVTWLDDDQARSAVIVAHADATLTLDDATGLGVDSEVAAHTVPLWTVATLATVNGLTLTAPEFAASSLNLAGGDIVWTGVNGIVERRTIMAHDGSSITILYGGVGLASGLAVVATPGCPQTWSGCAERGNTIHYGGALYKRRRASTDGNMSWD